MEIKCLLVFIPEGLYKKEAGYVLGKVMYDEHSSTIKYYVLDTSRTNVVNACMYPTDVIGYYASAQRVCGKFKQQQNQQRKNWLNIRLCPMEYSTYTTYDYCVTDVIINNRRFSSTGSRIVIVIYEQSTLRETELFADESSSGRHFSELIKLLQNKEVRRDTVKKRPIYVSVSDTLLAYHMYLYFYPILCLTKITNKLLPLLKYSFLGVHVNGWLENARWTLMTVIENKRFTLKTGNYVCAVMLDIVLGILALRVLSRYIGDTSPSEIMLNNAEVVVESLKGLINWLMGAPAGLKLNYAYNNMLGKFFLYHIQLWWTFLMFVKPVMDLAFDVLLLFGKLGLTFQISIAADLLALFSFHTYCIYVYAARLFNIQLRGIAALFRLFVGKKMNPLRDRVDSCQYQPDQLFVGTLLFTILLFLMPTTWIYYTVFTTLRLLSIGFSGFLTRLKFYLQVMPVYTFFKWSIASSSTCATVDMKLHSRRAEGPVTLIMTMAVTSWSRTWKKCIADTIVHYPAIKWNTIFGNLIWGQLLYPL